MRCRSDADARALIARSEGRVLDRGHTLSVRVAEGSESDCLISPGERWATLSIPHGNIFVPMLESGHSTCIVIRGTDTEDVICVNCEDAHMKHGECPDLTGCELAEESASFLDARTFLLSCIMIVPITQAGYTEAVHGVVCAQRLSTNCARDLAESFDCCCNFPVRWISSSAPNAKL